MLRSLSVSVVLGGLSEPLCQTTMIRPPAPVEYTRARRDGTTKSENSSMVVSQLRNGYLPETPASRAGPSMDVTTTVKLVELDARVPGMILDDHPRLRSTLR